MTHVDMTFLISGTSSGMGKYLHARFGGVAFRRDRPIDTFVRPEGLPYDAIVHCAFNAGRDITHDRMRAYFDDNTFLTERLLELPHRVFVYVSTADVYPKDGTVWTEAHEVRAEDMSGVYAISKFFSEAIVRERADRYLILRPTALLGRWMRPNTVVRILSGAAPKVGLHGDSTFNFIRHEQVGDIIEEALRQDVSGILNAASTDAVRLADVAAAFDRKVEFGDFVYRTVELANDEAAALVPALNRTSLEVLESFWNENAQYFG
jgi:nucleoside-diphosphate-sugar epimerase